MDDIYTSPNSIDLQRKIFSSMQEKFNFYHKELFKKIEETNILFFKSMGKGHGPFPWSFQLIKEDMKVQ